MVTQTIDINLVPGISAPVVNVSQYDVGREITFNLYNGTEAYTPTTGAVIVCNGTKSNGTGFASSTTWSGNVITVTTDAQMTDFAGISRCELVITVGDVRVGTANFLMKVEQAGVSEDTEFDPAQIAYVADALAQIGDAESVFDTLNARIDNIVAPSGDPTLTEVADARYSALTEETYASLTTRILTDDEYVDGKIGALASLGTTNKSNLVAAVNEVLSQANNGLTDDIKSALLNCFRHVAWIDSSGPTYFSALQAALEETSSLVSISASFDGEMLVTQYTELDDLKSHITVTGVYADSTTQTITNYEISGTLEVGTSQLTITSGVAYTELAITVINGLFAGEDFMIAQNGYTYPYYSTDATTRLSYIAFDMLFPGGHTYKLEISASESCYIGLQCFSQAILDRVNNSQDWTDIRSQHYDPGWQTITDNIATCAIPEYANGSPSPIVGFRLTLKNSSGTTISSNFVNYVHVTEVV